MKNLLACFFGGVVGSVLFMIFATYFLGDPFHDWFSSAFGILAADKQHGLDAADRIKIYDLLTRGLIISSDAVISNLTDLYGNMIQTLIGVLALATVLAAFAVRWQSVQAAQEYVDQKAHAYFHSADFNGQMKAAVQDYVDTLDPITNPQIAFAAAPLAVNQELADIRERLSILERGFRQRASAEENTEDAPNGDDY